jgi:hypothetical protein
MSFQFGFLNPPLLLPLSMKFLPTKKKLLDQNFFEAASLSSFWLQPTFRPRKDY